MKAKAQIQIICGTPASTREYVSAFHRAGYSLRLRLRPIVRAAGTHQPAKGVSVFLLDESGVEGQSKKSLKEAVKRLVEFAPVIVVAEPERQSELTGLLTSGAAEFVARIGKFVPLAVGLVERRVRLAKTSIPARSGGVNNAWPADFGELFRHEVNNPLTGILGNAEMLLARRDHLPASAIERLEIIAHLAVRLRETVRRLSSTAGPVRQAKPLRP
jgi:signal transduction histidine kinase